MNLMSRCKDSGESHEDDWHAPLSASQSLHQNTVLAMSNLLNANIDIGLMYAIGKWSLSNIHEIGLTWSVYDKDHMRALRIKSTSESDPRSYEVT